MKDLSNEYTCSKTRGQCGRHWNLSCPGHGGWNISRWLKRVREQQCRNKLMTVDTRWKRRRGGKTTGRLPVVASLRVASGKTEKQAKIDRNFDDFAVNLNADEIPISWTEKGRRARRRGLVAERCFPSINSTMESNEGVVWDSWTRRAPRRSLSWHEHDRKSAYATLRSNWAERIDTEAAENVEEVRRPKLSRGFYAVLSSS